MATIQLPRELISNIVDLSFGEMKKTSNALGSDIKNRLKSSTDDIFKRMAILQIKKSFTNPSKEIDF